MTTRHLEASAVDVARRRGSLTLPRVRPLRLVLAGAIVTVPAYPILFAATFLFLKLGESWSPAQVVVRPLIVILTAVAGLQVLLGRLAGRHVAAYFVGLVVLVLVEPVVAAFMLLAAVAPLAWRSVRARRAMEARWATFTGPLNVIAIGALATTLGAGITSGSLFVERPLPPASVVGTAPALAPDIYLILLDGYPRSDLLEQEIGVDNGPFLKAMTDLGFEVGDQSRSNYGRTALTLASMFNGRHVDELLPNPPKDVAGQARALNKLLNHGTELDLARAHGYELVSMPSPVGYVSLFAADRVIEPPTADEFELTLTEQGLMGQTAPDARHWLFLDQHRQRITDNLQTLATLPSERSARPRLVFAHLLVPHAPIAFGASGEEVMLKGCEWTLCNLPLPLPDEFRSDYAAQIQYVDGVVETTARQMIANSSKGLRPSVIIFFSDHGSRLTGTADSMYDNLRLSYTPGRPGLLPRDSTNVNLLPQLLNAYLGTNEPLAADVSYAHPNGAFLPLVRVDQ